jgi:hypothetical protein
MTSLYGAQVRESPAKPAPPRRSARGHYCPTVRPGKRADYGGMPAQPSSLRPLPRPVGPSPCAGKSFSPTWYVL